MKIKYLLIFGLISLIVFLIYLGTIDKKIYYLSLDSTDGYNNLIANKLQKNNILESYINEYVDNSYRITDLIKDIEDNKKITINGKTKTLKNALVKADIITISIGSTDLFNQINYTDDYDESYDYIDEMLSDLEKMIKLVKQYCKEDIFLIGYYNPYEVNKIDELFNYLNKKIIELCKEYKINYIDISKIIDDKKYIDDKLIINKDGNEAIYNEIFDKILKKVIKNT